MILRRNAWACISRIVVHFQTVFVIVCWNVSVASQKCQKCIMYLDTSKPGQLSQVTNQFISWCCNSATKHFSLYNALHKDRYETNLHQTRSSCKRLLIQRSSPDLQQLLLRHSPWAFWCRAKRRCHASFGRTRGVAPRPHKNFRNQTATASALCSEIASAEISLEEMHRKNHEPSPHLYYWVSFFFISLSSLKKVQDKTALHLQCCQVCWHQKLKESNMRCTWRGLQLAFLPLSPIAASKTSHSQRFSSMQNQTVQKTCNDVLSILAMLHFGGKGDYELTLSYGISLWKSVSVWLEVAGRILWSQSQATLDCKFAS